MNRSLILASCCVLLIVVAGCGGSQQRQLILVDDNGFPDCLVGVWKGDRGSWAFKFEPDGTILRMRHMHAGYVRMEEPGVFVEGPDEGTFASFTIGPAKAKYDPEQQILEVEVNIDD